MKVDEFYFCAIWEIAALRAVKSCLTYAGLLELWQWQVKLLTEDDMSKFFAAVTSK